MDLKKISKKELIKILKKCNHSPEVIWNRPHNREFIKKKLEFSLEELIQFINNEFSEEMLEGRDLIIRADGLEIITNHDGEFYIIE